MVLVPGVPDSAVVLVIVITVWILVSRFITRR